jgi:hypothetical protein
VRQAPGAAEEHQTMGLRELNVEDRHYGTACREDGTGGTDRIDLAERRQKKMQWILYTAGIFGTSLTLFPANSARF